MEDNKYLLDESGFALLTTLLLGILSLGLIVTAYYMVTSSAQLSGVEKRYSVELDTAKGVSDYVMAAIRNESLQCNPLAPGLCVGDSTPDVCAANAQIIIDANVCNALNRTAACTGVSACYTSSTPGVTPNTEFYSARVTSTSNNGETAIIDFVYRIVEN